VRLANCSLLSLKAMRYPFAASHAGPTGSLHYLRLERDTAI
jgi:hypothetical protein